MRKDIADKLVQMADRLICYCHVDTSWEVALGAVAVAYITGYPHYGQRVLQGYYSGEEADGVYELLWEAASLSPKWG